MTVTTSSHQDSGLKIQRRTTLGTVTVEMAIVAPILIMLLFGIIEFGWIFKDVLGLRQAAREGVRVATVGATTTKITHRIMDSAPALNTALFQIQLQYRTHSSSWSDWVTLGDVEATNNAPYGAQVRVTITYPHQLVTGGLFSNLADDPDSQTITLIATRVMRRE